MKISKTHNYTASTVMGIILAVFLSFVGFSSVAHATVSSCSTEFNDLAASITDLEGTGHPHKSGKSIEGDLMKKWLDAYNKFGAGKCDDSIGKVEDIITKTLNNNKLDLSDAIAIGEDSVDLIECIEDVQVYQPELCLKDK